MQGDMAETIDYNCSDLTEEEIAAYMRKLHTEQARERREAEKRMKKARSFRFSGGMC